MTSHITNYEIRDPQGVLMAVHVRIDQADGSKAYAWKRNGDYGLGGFPLAELPLYGAERLKDDAPGSTVIVCEGEKAAHALLQAGVQAVGTVTGARAAPADASLAPLLPFDVVLWPDNDPPGEHHMERVALRLRLLGKEPRWLRWPAAPRRGDAADYLAVGGTAAGVGLMAGAALAPLLPGDPTAAGRGQPEAGKTGPVSEGDSPGRRHDAPPLAAPAAAAAARTPVAPGGAVAWLTPLTLLTQTPQVVEWIVDGLLAPGCLTLLGGREKEGKSTLVWALLGAVLRGEPFLGLPTAPTPIVVLSEEGEGTLAEKLRAMGIAPDAPLSVLARGGLGAVRPTLEMVAAAAAAECDRTGARLVVVDTVAYWAGLKGEEENSSGSISEALWPVQWLASRGLAVLLLHHFSKKGDFRGSTALPAAVDILIGVTSPEGRKEGRKLEVVSRYSDSPAELHARLHRNGQIRFDREADDADDGGGDTVRQPPKGRDGIMDSRAWQHAAAVLDRPGGATIEQVAAALGVSRNTVTQDLQALMARGLVVRVGTGTRTNPYRFRAAGAPEPSLDLLRLPEAA